MMSGVESLLHGSWSWLLSCHAMTDGGPPPDSPQGTAQKGYLSGP